MFKIHYSKKYFHYTIFEIKMFTFIYYTNFGLIAFSYRQINNNSHRNKIFPQSLWYQISSFIHYQNSRCMRMHLSVYLRYNFQFNYPNNNNSLLECIIFVVFNVWCVISMQSIELHHIRNIVNTQPFILACIRNIMYIPRNRNI